MSEENKDSAPEFVPPSYDELRDENARLRAENERLNKWAKAIADTAEATGDELVARAEAAEANVAALTKGMDELKQASYSLLDAIKYGQSENAAITAKLAQMREVVEAAKERHNDCPLCEKGKLSGMGPCRFGLALSRLTAPEKKPCVCVLPCRCGLLRDSCSAITHDPKECLNCPPSPGKGE